MKVVTSDPSGAISVSEIPDPPQVPLSPVGALATLLAVEQVLTVEDAANAVGCTTSELIAEAEAWQAASQATP